MTINSRITAADYNAIQSALNSVMGTGGTVPFSGAPDPSYGYGQVLQSSQVSLDTRIRSSDWANLSNDINNINRHQTGTALTLYSVASNELVRSTGSSSYTGFISGNILTVLSVTSGMVATGQTISGPSVIPGTTITGPSTVFSVNVSSFGSKTITTGNRYTVVLNIPTQPVAIPVGTEFEITGNSNSLYNERLIVTASTTTSLTFVYLNDPGTFGTGTTVLTATRNNPWGVGRWVVSQAQTVASTTITGTSPTNYPKSDYSNVISSLASASNRFRIDPISQAITTNKGIRSITFPNPSNTFWNSFLNITADVSFTTADRARYFFNSGGEIRFTFTRFGGSPTSQNASWTSILSTATAQLPSFGANKPGTGLTPSNGQNFYRLSSTYTTWYTISGSSPYGSNTLRISARCMGGPSNNSTGTVRQFQFLIELIDGYTDPGPPAPGDLVDGTFELTVSTLEATGALSPIVLGNWNIESPTVTIGSWSGS